jgi:hypothetical protein
MSAASMKATSGVPTTAMETAAVSTTAMETAAVGTA